MKYLFNSVHEPPVHTSVLLLSLCMKMHWSYLCCTYASYYMKCPQYVCMFHLIVSVDANFCIKHTALTVGGLTQPTTARDLIKHPASVEKGLTQRFLWLIPEPSFSKFDSLEPANEEFVSHLSEFDALVSRASSMTIVAVHYHSYCIVTHSLMHR